MKGELRDLTFGRNGEQHITVTVREDFRKRFDDLSGADVNIEIKKYRKPRSLDANAYAWVLIDKIAASIGADKATVYREVIRNIGGVSKTVCVMDSDVESLRHLWEKNGLGWQTETTESKVKGCTNVILYQGSSTYDTKQMSSLIDQLVFDAKELGIETLPPDELRRLTEAGKSEDKTKE
jgi:hypothetical protein